jgi:hypothetical protein
MVDLLLVVVGKVCISKRTGNTALYDCDELRRNWNYWCKTGEDLFGSKKELEERW